MYLIRGKYWAIVTVEGRRYRLGDYADPNTAEAVVNAFLCGVDVAAKHIIDNEKMEGSTNEPR